jgi:hypothetical protein
MKEVINTKTIKFTWESESFGTARAVIIDGRLTGITICRTGSDIVGVCLRIDDDTKFLRFVYGCLKEIIDSNELDFPIESEKP